MEKMYRRALDGYEKAWGPEHTSTPKNVNNIGLLHADQGNVAEAEEMFMRALCQTLALIDQSRAWYDLALRQPQSWQMIT